MDRLCSRSKQLGSWPWASAGLKFVMRHGIAYQNDIADVSQLFFDLLPVFFCHTLLLFASLRLRLYAGDDPPRRTPCTDHIFISNWEEISLFIAQFHTKISDLLHCLRHIIVPLCLFSKLGPGHQLLLVLVVFRHFVGFLGRRTQGNHHERSALVLDQTPSYARWRTGLAKARSRFVEINARKLCSQDKLVHHTHRFFTV